MNSDIEELAEEGAEDDVDGIIKPVGENRPHSEARDDKEQVAINLDEKGIPAETVEWTEAVEDSKTDSDYWDDDDDNYLTTLARIAVKTELERKHALGLPISKFNPKTKLVYLEYEDGHIEEIGYAMQNGRYGERKTDET